MHTFFTSKIRFAICSALLVVLVAGTVAVSPLPAKAEPVSIASAAVTVVTVAVVAACELNAFGICPPKNSGGSSGGSTGGVKVTPATPSNTTNGNTPSGSGGSTGGGSVGAICTSAPNPVCGITSQGTLVNGVCNATTPANSACPAPAISGNGGFYADPSLVRSGNSSTLHWSVTNATICAVTGGGLDLNNLGTTGTTGTGAVTQKTTYTLTCVNGSDGPVSSVNTSINLVPNTIEQ